MFACLELRNKDSRFFLERRRALPPLLSRVNIPGGAPFFRLEAAAQKGGSLPWAEIERTAGRLRTKMLFPAGLTPPPVPEARSAAQAQLEPGLRAFAPKRLPLLLCLRQAQQVLRLCGVSAQGLRVTIVDTRGLLNRALEPLVPLAGSLRVFTPDFSLYRSTASQLLHRYGVTLVLSDSAACFSQSQVVIADDLRLFTGRERGLIFTPDLTAVPGCRIVRCNRALLPEPYATLCPPGIDPLLFACALYELCGAKEMERLQFDHFTVDGTLKPCDSAALAAMIDDTCGAALSLLYQ